MKLFRFHPDALRELTGAAAFYDRHSNGLGAALIDETGRAIGRIVEMPEAYPLEGKRTRRCPLPRFPYNVFYAIGPDCIRVIAFAHQKRRPFYWRKRLNDA